MNYNLSFAVALKLFSLDKFILHVFEAQLSLLDPYLLDIKLVQSPRTILSLTFVVISSLKGNFYG